jgi:Tfp pilus assembly protein PilF
MKNIRRTGWIVVSALLLSACTTMNRGNDPMSSDSPAEQKVAAGMLEQKSDNPAELKLEAGIANYQKGKFKLSAEEIQHALRQGLSNKRDEVAAHKYLAFTYCVSKRKLQCRHEFRTVLQIDPAFNLKPSEAGHPVWGPIFASEKAKSAKLSPRRPG